MLVTKRFNFNSKEHVRNILNVFKGNGLRQIDFRSLPRSRAITLHILLNPFLDLFTVASVYCSLTIWGSVVILCTTTFNIKNLYVLATEGTCVFRVYLRTTSNFFLVVYKTEAKSVYCSVRAEYVNIVQGFLIFKQSKCLLVLSSEGITQSFFSTGGIAINVISPLTMTAIL